MPGGRGDFFKLIKEFLDVFSEEAKDLPESVQLAIAEGFLRALEKAIEPNTYQLVFNYDAYGDNAEDDKS